MAKKTFDTHQHKRNVSETLRETELTDVSIESIDDLLDKDEIKKEDVNEMIAVINNDKNISLDQKEKLSKYIVEQFYNLYNFDNCPDDYETLKKEAKYLSGFTQVSFLLMAQRLKKIKDNKLYEEDGFPDFKAFVESEMNVSRQTAYKYIDLIDYFGVSALKQENINYSKLLPFIPILKLENDNIPKNEIKSSILKDIRKKTFREMEEEAKLLKVKFGLIKTKDDNNQLLDLADVIANKIVKAMTVNQSKKLTIAGKEKIKNLIKDLSEFKKFLEKYI